MPDCSELQQTIADLALSIGEQPGQNTIQKVVETIQAEVPEITRQEVVDAIVASTTRGPRILSEIAKQLEAIKREAKNDTTLQARIKTLEASLKSATEPPPTRAAPKPPPAEIAALRSERDRLNEELRAVVPKPADMERVQNRIAELQAHMAAGTAPGRMTPHAAPAELAALRVERTKLANDVRQAERLRGRIAELDAHLKAGTVPGTKPRTSATNKVVADLAAVAQQLRTQVRKSEPAVRERLAKSIEGLQERLKSADPSPPVREPRATSKQIERMEYEQAKLRREINERIQAMKPKGIMGRIFQFTSIPRIIETTGEMSVVGRQAGLHLFSTLGHTVTHPLKPTRLINDLKAFGKGVGAGFSRRLEHKYDSEIEARPNRPLYERANLRILNAEQRLTGAEEIAISSLIDRVPVVSHLVHAFNRFSRVFLNQVKADHFDAMARSVRGGEPTLREAKVIADMANMMAGTTGLGKAEVTVPALNAVLYSARYLASRFRFLAGPIEFLARGSAGTRAAYAKEMANILLGAATVYSMAHLAGLEVGTDPRSTNFGKIRVGDTWIDILGGLSQLFVFGTRVATQEKITNKGKLQKLGGGGPYDDSTLSLSMRLLRQKISPNLSVMVDYADDQQDMMGKPMDAEYWMRKVSPLTWWDVGEAMAKETGDRAAAMSLAAWFGAGLQSREDPRPSRPTRPKRPVRPTR